MIKPILSIIIPMFNAEATIQRCLDSLLNQSIKQLEIIVIDDKSIDKSYSIAEKYKEKFSDFVLIQNSENLGAGASKNIGLDIAKADIIGFIDADDFVDVSYYENMLNAINEHEADIACSDIALTYTDHMVYSDLLDENPFLTIQNIKLNNNGESIVILPEAAAAHWGAAAAPAKLFKKNIVQRFFEGICDDIPFTFSALARAEKIVYVPNNYYYYFQTENSLERSDFSEVRLGLAKSISKAADIILSNINKHTEIVKIIYGYSAWPILIDILSKQNDRENYLERYYCDLKYKELLNDNLYFEKNLVKKSWGEQRFILKLVECFLERQFEEMCHVFDQYGSAPYYYLPRVSIVIPVYNGSNYLQEAIESSLMQNYPNLEVLVVNDGSRDNGATENIAKSFGNRIKYFYKKNGGVASALNYGIEHMTGEYFSWLSHDDLYKKDKILKQIEALQDLSDKRTIVICGYELVNEKLDKLYDVNLLDLYEKEKVESPLFAVFRGGINGCCTLIHKSHFDRVGMFDVNLPTTQDYDLWFRIMRGQKICYMSNNYVLSRSHEAQDSKKLFDKHIVECNKLWIGLLEQLNDEEKKIISGTVNQFYMEERAFFEKLPYDKVVSYLDGKLLELLRDSLQRKNTDDVSELYAILDIQTEILDSKEMLRYALGQQKKYAIVLPEKKSENRILWDNVDQIRSVIRDGELVYVVLSEERDQIEWIDWSKTVVCPTKIIKSIPSLLKLLNVQLCVISDYKNYGQEILHLKCVAMGIKSIVWKSKKYWLLNDNVSLRDYVAQMLESENAELVIWTDKVSCRIDKELNDKAIYIPLSNEENKIEEIKQMWKSVFFLNYKYLILNQEFNLDMDYLKKTIVNCEKVILQINENMEKNTTEKIVYQNVDGGWEARYYGIVNSTCWRLTAPIRDVLNWLKKKRKQ